MGQISNIKLHSDNNATNLIITTGINDGIINVIDMKSNKKVFSKQLHRAAINYVGTNDSNLLITGSADKTIKIFDMLNGFAQIGELKSADAVFCGDVYGNILAVGCGDGNLLAYNLDTMECLYGFGCEEKGGVKIVKFVPEKKRILTGGDSGKGLELVF